MLISTTAHISSFAHFTLQTNSAGVCYEELTYNLCFQYKCKSTSYQHSWNAKLVQLLVLHCEHLLIVDRYNTHVTLYHEWTL